MHTLAQQNYHRAIKNVNGKMKKERDKWEKPLKEKMLINKKHEKQGIFKDFQKIERKNGIDA